MPELHVFTEPQNGASYEQLSRVARATEECGFAGFFRSDHYLTIQREGGLPGPTDSWVTLAGLALETKRIRLGTLMTCATFRLPGPLAISVAQVDQMSQGRVDLGIGAGWYAAEHAAYGVPSPARRSASSAWRSSWRSSPVSGPLRRDLDFPSQATTISWWRHQPCPNRGSGRGLRS